VRAKTADLWAKQDRHTGDRHRLFASVADAVEVTSVLYPGSYVDVAASFVWSAVTYVDVDRRAAAFFDDVDGVREIIATQPGAPEQPEITFVHADYTTDLSLEPDSFDLLVSLYAGPISRHCTRYLRVGGWLLVNPSHGDVALASIDDRYELRGLVRSRSGSYSVSTDALDTYLIPKKPVEITVESIESSGRGVAYTKSPFAYLFRRIV
jgi:hypothetical protein